MNVFPALVPPGPITTTETLPARRFGAVNRSCVAETRVKDTARPPIETRVAPVKPVPLIVTAVDVVVRPIAGLSVPMTGRAGATAVKVSALLVPPAVVTTSDAPPAGRDLTKIFIDVELTGV